MAADIALERSLRSVGGFSATGEGSVPVIDMAQSEEKVADAVWRAANEVGFFSVVNHGVSQEAVEAAFASSEAFFAQPLEAKKAQSPFAPAKNSGFESFSQVRPSTGTPDQKESLQITAREGCMDDRWPTEPADFKSVAEAMSAEASALAARLMAILEAKACSHLQPGTLTKSHTLWGDQGQCTLRMLHYPGMTVENLRELTKGDAHWRAGPHTDWSTLTLLFQKVGQGGLECRANPRSKEQQKGWIAVSPLEGGIAVNVGDMLARWSDGNLYSNLHRVRMPTEAECTRPRYSIAFFAQADKAALITSKKEEPITAGDYILSRIKSNFAGPK